MGTNYIAPTWRMPENTNKDNLSNYSLEFGPATADIISTNTTWQTDVGLDNVTKVSFSAWVNPNSGTGSSIMAVTSQAYGSWNGNFNITYRADITTLALEFRGAGGIFINNSTTLAGDTWHHICFVLDLTLGGTIAQEVRCFVNNSEVANQSSQNPPLNFILKTTTFNIGRTLWGETSPSGSGYQWQGKIAQACFFDYALSDGTGGTTNQIEYLYNLNNPMAMPGGEPVAYWPLGDNSNPNSETGYPNISVSTDSVFDFDPTSTPIEQLLLYPTTERFEPQILTISVWVNPSSIESGSYVNHIAAHMNSSWKGWALYFKNNDLKFQIGDKDTTAVGGAGGNWSFSSSRVNKSLIPLNTWTHICCTWDGTDAKIFINGVCRKIATPPSQLTIDYGSVNDIFAIGYRNDATSGSWGFDGKISNFQFWGVALTDGQPAENEAASEEVAQLYNNGQPLIQGEQPDPEDLVAWYKLNQSANWEAEGASTWQIPNAVSAYPQSFDIPGASNAFIDGGNNFFTPYITSPNRWAVGTISFWLNTAETGYNGLLNSSSGWILRFDNQSAQRFFWLTGAGNSYVAWSGVTIADSKWHHIALVIPSGSDKTQAKLYIDNELINVAIIAGSNDGTGGNMESLVLGADRVFSGTSNKFSNFTFHNIAFDDTQIETLYNNGVPLTTQIETTNLKAWYKLDNTEIFDDTKWEIQNQKYPVNYESALKVTAIGSGITTRDPIISNSTTHSTSWWVKYDFYRTREDLILIGQGLAYYLMYVQNSGRMGFRPTTGSALTISPSSTYKAITINNTGKWYNYVFIRDGGNIKLYENNVKVWDTTMAAGTENTATDLIQGFANLQSYAGTGSNYSNFSFFDTAISESDVQTLYNNGTPLTDVSSLTAINNWYKLDNLTLGLKDSVSGNNATAVGNVAKVNTFVSNQTATSSNMTEQNLVNNNVATTNLASGGMDTTNLVIDNLTRKKPYSNYSFNFDATSTDYIQINNPGNIIGYGESAFTFSGWINADVFSDQDGIFCRRASNSSRVAIKLSLTSPYNGIMLQAANGGSASGYSSWDNILTEGQWYHICAIYDGTQSADADRFKLWVNGVDQGTRDVGSTDPIPTTLPNMVDAIPIEIGVDVHQSLPSRCFNGRTSNFCMFDRVLTEQEILKIYNNGVTQDLQATSSFSNNILGWWPMDDRSSYYDGNDWVVRDLEGGKDGNGINTGNVEDMVGNAPGSEANGVGSNLTIADLKGNMYNSDKNAYSINMADYADGVTNPANSGRSTDTP